ncbi:MAG: hypothetical protein NTX22_11020 [Ignavibacteriales bacterium]|nr:hypothetical protein [Ignavibacteriales bacterium]
MKVLRENNVEYYPFYKFLEDLSSNYGLDKKTGNSLLNYSNNKGESNYFEKYNYVFNVLTSFEKETLNLSDIKKILNVFNDSLKKILPTKESSLLFFDTIFSTLTPLEKKKDLLTNSTMNSYYKEGILNNIFDTKLSTVIPLLSSYQNDGPKFNFLIVPIFEENKRRGLLTLLTTLKEENITEFDKKLVELLLLLTLSKIDKIVLRKKVTSIHEDLKTYQAKLSNDYRLAAIGEMTHGIVEDILSPLQVLISQIDMIKFDKQNKFEIDLLKAQINKINQTVGRLVKFVDANPDNAKIRPCNLNEVISDFYQIFKSTLQNLKIECELDLQKDIPPILSHPNNLNQILTHVFGMVKNSNKDEGAVILQTRYQGEEIVVKLISSNNLSIDSTSGKNNQAEDLNVKIIDNLMVKHEGKFSITSTDIGSSIITLTFPLRRKLRV